MTLTSNLSKSFSKPISNPQKKAQYGHIMVEWGSGCGLFGRFETGMCECLAHKNGSKMELILSESLRGGHWWFTEPRWIGML